MKRIKLNSLTRRCDTVVYDQHLDPLMIIEYKESNISITQDVFDQVVRYNTRSEGAIYCCFKWS